MKDKNLPPGCSPGEIPGNGPEQAAYEQAAEHFIEAVRLLWNYGFGPEDAARYLQEVWIEYEQQQEAISESRQER